jgi:hypothetical protein
MESPFLSVEEQKSSFLLTRFFYPDLSAFGGLILLKAL